MTTKTENPLRMIRREELRAIDLRLIGIEDALETLKEKIDGIQLFVDQVGLLLKQTGDAVSNLLESYGGER